MNEQKVLNGIRNIGRTVIGYGILIFITYLAVYIACPEFLQGEGASIHKYAILSITGCVVVDTICNAFVKGYEGKQ